MSPSRAALLAAALLAGTTTSTTAGARSFTAEGSDTGAGLGAAQVAQGGTGVAAANDVHALFYNPAGLAQVQGFELSASRQLNADLRKLNFLGAAWRVPLDEARWGLQATLAAAYYLRIHARAQGAFDESDFESLFLRYLLPGISGQFDGEIESKTKAWRVALGLAPARGAAWSAGLTLERIDCRSTFCGVHATSNGFTTQSTGATATALGFGLRWQPQPNLSLGLAVSDVDTRLTIRSTTTDATGTRQRSTQAAFPRKVAAGAAWLAAPGTQLAADVEVTRGRYGRSQMDLRVMRLGAEHQRGPWAWRAGAVLPWHIASSETGRLRPPFPLGPTAGVGWREGPWRVDLAVYAHAVMSMHAGSPHAAADLSLGLAF